MECLEHPSHAILIWNSNLYKNVRRYTNGAPSELWSDRRTKLVVWLSKEMKKKEQKRRNKTYEEHREIQTRTTKKKRREINTLLMLSTFFLRYESVFFVEWPLIFITFTSKTQFYFTRGIMFIQNELICFKFLIFYSYIYLFFLLFLLSLSFHLFADCSSVHLLDGNYGNSISKWHNMFRKCSASRTSTELGHESSIHSDVSTKRTSKNARFNAESHESNNIIINSTFIYIE